MHLWHVSSMLAGVTSFPPSGSCSTSSPRPPRDHCGESRNICLEGCELLLKDWAKRSYVLIFDLSLNAKGSSSNTVRPCCRYLGTWHEISSTRCGGSTWALSRVSTPSSVGSSTSEHYISTRKAQLWRAKVLVVEMQMSRVTLFFTGPHFFSLFDGLSGRVDRPPTIVCDPNMVWDGGESRFVHAWSILKHAGVRAPFPW